MKRTLVFALIVTVLGACNGPQTGPESQGAGGTGTSPIPGPTEDNIGDLEQAVIITAEVAQQSESDTIESSPLVDPTGRMNLLTIDVAPPYPEELWLNINVRPRRSFPKNPGVLRFAIKDGDTVLGTFNMVIGNTNKEEEHVVDLLAARDAIPESMLVTMDVEALLMPEGTDPDSVDPATAEVPESRYSRAVQTPPIRINFEGASSQPSEPSEPPEASEEDTPPAEEPAEDAAPAAEGS